MTALPTRKDEAYRYADIEALAFNKAVAKIYEFVGAIDRAANGPDRAKAQPERSRGEGHRDREDRLLRAAHDDDPHVPILVVAPNWLGDVVLEAKGLAKGFDGRSLMHDLSFTLPRAGIVGVIGPNGVGKTTLFRMITGEEQADEGDDENGERAPFHQFGEARVIADMHRDILSRRTNEQWLFFGHECSLRTSVGGVHNKGLQTPQVLTQGCTPP